MPVLKLSKEEAQSIVWGEHPTAKIADNRIYGHSRWSIQYDLVFKLDNKLYKTKYSIGSTEQQDEQPFEYEDEVECVEVEAYTQTIIDYRPVKDVA